MNDLFPLSDLTFRQIRVDGSVSKTWPAAELNLKTKVVCAKCNNEWMSDLEASHAKPAMSDLILGKEMDEITPSRARSIALFAFKTAVIANRSLPENEFFFDESARHAFRESLSIPPHVAMWIVGMQPVVGGGISSHNVYFPNETAPYLTLNVCSFWVGQLGFQVVSAKSVRAGQAESLPTPPNLTVRFHPAIERNIFWPRPVVLTVEAFNDFANRWNMIRR